MRNAVGCSCQLCWKQCIGSQATHCNATAVTVCLESFLVRLVAIVAGTTPYMTMTSPLLLPSPILGTATAEELVSLGLDFQRNQILGVEMLITLLSTAFGLGAFIVGVFGMNLQWDGGPLDPGSGQGGVYFAFVVVGTVGLQVVGAVSVGRWLFKRFPRLFSI